ncbi:MAG: flagellar motor switch protein FliN [bacterium]|nr:flagellar motor switch protein FliN [bacterium]
MSEVFRSVVSEESRVTAEKQFTEQFSASLRSFIEREVRVEQVGPFALEYREVKATLPGEIVICTILSGDLSAGRTHFLLSKEHAAILADLINMGDGGASFVPEEHLEPIRDLFKEVVSTFFGEVAKNGGPRLIADEAKAVVMDISPQDFVGSWTVTELDIFVGANVRVIKITANEMLDSLFPPEASQKKAATRSGEPESIDPSLKKEMSLVMDIELPIAIELGRTNMLIRDIVKLSPGSVVELDKLSGEPVDLYVNNKRFARGEVVVVEENFAVRITELINPEERFGTTKN